MIYTNKDLKIKSVEMSFGTINGIVLGEKGRGRKELFLPTPPNITSSEQLKDCSIGFTKSGKPRINNGDDGNYAIICTSGGYTRRGNGGAAVLKASQWEVLGTAYGADGDAGRIGSWLAVVVKLPALPTYITVKIAGGYPADLIYWDGKIIQYIKSAEIYSWVDFNRIDLPFKYVNGEISFPEWQGV